MEPKENQWDAWESTNERCGIAAGGRDQPMQIFSMLQIALQISFNHVIKDLESDKPIGLPTNGKVSFMI